MGLSETLIFYLCVGTTIAVAAFLTDGRQGAWRTGFVLLTALLFWPLYVPLLISARTARQPPADTPAVAEGDEMAAAIAQVELELEAALSSLDGWAENALAAQADRLAELCHALRAQAGRIREMDRLLAATVAEPPAANSSPQPATTAGSPAAGDALERWQKSRHARATNLGRLAAGPPANACRFDGHLGLDSGIGLDDPPGQVHRRPRFPSRRAGGPDRRRGRRGFGRRLARDRAGAGSQPQAPIPRAGARRGSAVLTPAFNSRPFDPRLFNPQ